MELTKSLNHLERHRASVICLHQDQLLTVILKDPYSKITRHFLPGGAIEPNESPEEAAKRETLEETGYLVRIDRTISKYAEYFFVWNNQNVFSKTHFFRGFLINQDPIQEVNDADYHCGVYWMPKNLIAESFSYHLIIQKNILELIFSC